MRSRGSISRCMVRRWASCLALMRCISVVIAASSSSQAPDGVCVVDSTGTNSCKDPKRSKKKPESTVLVIEDAFTPTECKDIIKDAKEADRVEDIKDVTKRFNAWKFSWFGKGKKRNWLENRVFDIMQKHNTWFDVSGFDNVHVKEYLTREGDQTGYFGWHVDMEYENTRLLTFTVQLSAPDEYTGGELQVAKDKPTNKQGTLVLFPSWMMHQVSPLSSGSRYVLVGWFEPSPGKKTTDYIKYARPHYERMVKYADEVSSEETHAVDGLRFEALMLLSFAYEFLEVPKRALQTLKRADKVRPNQITVVGKIAQGLLQLERYGEALGYIEQAVNLEPDNEGPRELLAQVREIVSQSAGH